jgi:site-specific recombinase XerD
MPYPATKLVSLKGKHYVNCTIPPELRPWFSDRKQYRLSTGTSDRKLAELRQYDLTRQIYAKFDEATEGLKGNRLKDLEAELGYPVEDLDSVHIPKEAPDTGDLEEMVALEAHYAALQAKVDALKALDTSHTIEGLCHAYMASQPYAQNRAATAREVVSILEEFSQFVGPTKDVAKLTPRDAYRYAEAQAEAGKANKTITKKLGYVRQCLDWAVQQGHLELNPFIRLKLAKYGKKSERWKPFTTEELTQLFKLDMKRHERVLLTILATTGMRLDEAALLKWDDIKEQDGVRYFDLADSVVKNVGSARQVPVPAETYTAIVNYKLSSQMGGKQLEERLFPQYNLNADGKTTGVPTYVLLKLVKQITDDKRKVVHSLRGSFKDMLRDAGVSKEVNDFITGHSGNDVASGYGKGPSLKTKAEAMALVDFSFVNNK